MDESPNHLNKRPQQVTLSVYLGQSDEETGKFLNIKPKTVEAHKAVVWDVCCGPGDNRNNTTMVRWAVESGTIATLKEEYRHKKGWAELIAKAEKAEKVKLK